MRARRFEAMSRGHSERLVPMIEEVMAEAGNDTLTELGDCHAEVSNIERKLVRYTYDEERLVFRGKRIPSTEAGSKKEET